VVVAVLRVHAAAVDHVQVAGIAVVAVAVAAVVGACSTFA
jgi:hypothetical protein